MTHALSHSTAESLAKRGGCGIIFYRKQPRSVLLQLRDNIPSISFPNTLDLLGGHIEEDESPEQAILREIREELIDKRTSLPFTLTHFDHVTSYDSAWGVQHIFACEADFEITDLILCEGQKLIWLPTLDLKTTKLAFDFNEAVENFFKQLRP